MEFALILNAPEAKELHRLIDKTLAAMRVELRHTDSREFKAELMERVNCLEDIDRKLAEIEPTVAILR